MQSNEKVEGIYVLIGLRVGSCELFNDTAIPRHNNINIMNYEQQEWIDRYLFGELKGEERRRFEAKFAIDQAFRADVELQAEIMVSINSYTASKPKAVPLPTTSKLVWIKYGLRVAAMVALVILAGLTFQITNQMRNTLLANHIEMINNYNLTDFQRIICCIDEELHNVEEIKTDTENIPFMNYPKQFEDRA